jgi:hypothetical protein
MGLKPHPRVGGGHVNVDVNTAFPDNNALLFRNFVVDQANHPELIAGIFGNHTGNAPPISALEPQLHSVFADVIQIFDETAEAKAGLPAMQHLGSEIQKRVYVSNPYWLLNDRKTWTPSYYQHLSFRSVSSSISQEQRRLELRGFRPQQSIDEFLLELEFLDGRLTYLNELDVPLEVNIPENINFTREEKIMRFRQIIAETGLDPQRFEYFIEYDFEANAYNRNSPSVDSPTNSPAATIRKGSSPRVSAPVCQNIYLGDI